MKTRALAPLGIAAALLLAIGGDSAEGQTQLGNADEAREFLRKGLTNGVLIKTENSYSELSGELTLVKFANDSDLPAEAQSNGCRMVINVKTDNGNASLGIDFSNIEGVSQFGGYDGFVNAPYDTKIFINGPIVSTNAKNKLFEFHHILFVFHMKTTRDRVVRAMRDLHASCSKSEGPY